MAVHLPVVRKYRIGDHVALEAIMAVGEVIDRRGVMPTGLGADSGEGRYLVRFRGVPEAVHRDILRSYCRCPAHAKVLHQMGGKKTRAMQPGELRSWLLKELADAEGACESSFSPGVGGMGTSSVWYDSNALLNCSGKERLPLNVNVRYGTPAPYFEQTPMGTWDPSKAPRYARPAR